MDIHDRRCGATGGGFALIVAPRQDDDHHGDRREREEAAGEQANPPPACARLLGLPLAGEALLAQALRQSSPTRHSVQATTPGSNEFAAAELAILSCVVLVDWSPAAGAAPSRRGPRRVVLFGALPAIVLFLSLLTYGLLAKAPDTGIDDTLASGRAGPAPAFELALLERGDLGPPLERALGPALADGRIALRELRGRQVVLNFWASWCVPCQEEAPLLERSWLNVRDRGVVFLGLNMQDVTGDARSFMRRYRNTYLNVRDPTNRVARKWGLTGLPETFFITARGKVVGHVIGVVSEAQMAAGMAALRSGRPAGSSQGGDRRRTR